MSGYSGTSVSPDGDVAVVAEVSTPGGASVGGRSSGANEDSDAAESVDGASVAACCARVATNAARTTERRRLRMSVSGETRVRCRLPPTRIAGAAVEACITGVRGTVETDADDVGVGGQDSKSGSGDGGGDGDSVDDDSCDAEDDDGDSVGVGDAVDNGRCGAGDDVE